MRSAAMSGSVLLLTISTFSMRVPLTFFAQLTAGVAGALIAFSKSSAILLQTEQVWSYRAQRDADLADLDDREAD